MDKEMEKWGPKAGARSPQSRSRETERGDKGRWGRWQVLLQQELFRRQGDGEGQPHLAAGATPRQQSAPVSFKESPRGLPSCVEPFIK